MSNVPRERRFGQIVTFYSYKGGTGRSMALANVAYLLARERAAKVLMIDWDLEAPGLHRYFDGDLEGRGLSPTASSYNAQLDRTPGLLELVALFEKHYRIRQPSGGLPEAEAVSEQAVSVFESAREAVPLDRFVLKVRSVPGLHLIKAGRQRRDPEEKSYAQQVRTFRWDTFYKEYGSFFAHFRELLMQRFDWILIDSRTGLTDMGGICTRVMPEKLVAVFIPNRQNLDGILQVTRQAVEYRQRSRDPRPLGIFPLASRIDGSRRGSDASGGRAESSTAGRSWATSASSRISSWSSTRPSRSACVTTSSPRRFRMTATMPTVRRSPPGWTPRIRSRSATRA